MPRTVRAIWLAGAFGLAAGVAYAQDDLDDPKEADAVLDRTPEQCLSLSRIRRTRVVDDQTVLFYVRSREIYQNILPRDCPGLSSNDRFMYRPFSNRLCDTDTITVLEQFGGRFERGMTCRLGAFYRITEIEADEMLEAHGKGRRGSRGRAPVEAEPAELPEDEAAENGDDE